MTDFFDWLTAADSGLGTDRLRERFRLSEAEMRRVTEALAPAFLLGLQRLSGDPTAFADFMRRMTPFGGAGAGQSLPTDMLDRVFGSSPRPDSIARQASLLAGVSPGTIADMMPELAMMTVRTMMRMAGTPGATPFSGPLPGDAGGLAMAEMMRRSANAVEAFSRPSAPPTAAPGLPSFAYLDTLFSDALRGGFPWMTPPGATAGKERETARMSGKQTERREIGTRETGASETVSPFFAFAPLLDAFARNGTTPEDAPRESTARKAEPKPQAPDPLDGLTQAMEAGRSLQETYAQEMLAFFGRHRRDD